MLSQHTTNPKKGELIFAAANTLQEGTVKQGCRWVQAVSPWAENKRWCVDYNVCSFFGNVFWLSQICQCISPWWHSVDRVWIPKACPSMAGYESTQICWDSSFPTGAIVLGQHFSVLQEIQLNRSVRTYHAKKGKFCVTQDEFLEHGDRFFQSFQCQNL